MTVESISRLLDELAPAAVDEPAWEDVLARAALLAISPAIANGRPPVELRVRSRRSLRGLARRVRQRPLLVVLVLLAVALVPVSALAVAKDDPWWFLRFQSLGFGPAKGASVVVIERGSWDGQGWVFTGYRGVRGSSLCTQFTETLSGQPTKQGSGGCGALAGTTISGPRRAPRKLTITFGGGTMPMLGGHGSIHYITGDVVASATTVAVTLIDGTVVRAPTFVPPASLGVKVRFFVTQLPTPQNNGRAHLSCRQNVAQSARLQPRQVVGLDSGGRVVARLMVPPRPGLSLMCQPHQNHVVLPQNLPIAARELKALERITGPYGASATIAVGGSFEMRSGRFLPNGRIKHFSQLSRCVVVRFSNGQSQGGCYPLAKRYEPELSPEVQHAGRDTFVIVNAGPRIGVAIARVDLQLANGQTLSKTPVNGVVVYAIPKDALSTKKSQRGWLIAYDKTGKVLVQDNAFGHARFKRQAVYYRSCPPGSSCYG